ncbi:MAG: DNA polymerase III subunit epsilon [Gammaproteobacteria bacterium]|jgi:DNA polymerase III subunit epsilon
MNRQIVLDTETTGLEVEQGHRIIEIGCLELINRRLTRHDFHLYCNPERPIDAGAVEVHGLTTEFLAGKPLFRDLADELWAYLEGAELIIHNAPFDLGFLNAEFARAGRSRRLEEVCTITDTVRMARKLLPGQRVSLDALCKRYGVDNSHRDFHGALLDARLLADVYLSMTGGQSALGLDEQGDDQPGRGQRQFVLALAAAAQRPLAVVVASDEERTRHQARLRKMADKGACLWQDELN